MGLALTNGLALENGAKGLINRLARAVVDGEATVDQAADIFVNRGKVEVARRDKFAQRRAVRMGDATPGKRGAALRQPNGKVGPNFAAAIARLRQQRAAQDAAHLSQSGPGIAGSLAFENPGVFGGLALENTWTRKTAPTKLADDSPARLARAESRNAHAKTRRAIIRAIKARDYKIDGNILKSAAQRRPKNHLKLAVTKDGRPLYVPGTKDRYMTTDAAAVQRDLAKRVKLRNISDNKRMSGVSDEALFAEYGDNSTMTGVRRWQRKKNIEPGTSTGRRRRGPLKKGSPEALQWGAEMAARKAAKSGGAKNNPGVFGGLALENPLSGRELLGSAKYALVAGGVGAVSGAVHYKLVPWVTENVYVHGPEFLTEYNYAITGLAGGVVLGAAAGMLRGDLRNYALAAGTGVAMAGGLLQVFKYLGLINEEGTGTIDEIVEEIPVLGSEFGPVAAADAAAAGEIPASTQPMAGVFGGVAHHNAGVFGALAHHNTGVFGDGMAYQLASVAGGLTGQNFGDANFDEGVSTYSGASLADALHSGADLDVEEGEAACMGQHAYLDKFGYPPVRISQMGGHRGASHLAGRRGHRWGWLIKMVGFRKFQELAQLPPERRLLVLRQMRAAAVQQFEQSLKNVTVPVESPTAVSGHTSGVPMAPEGVGSNYGATLFASPEYLG